MTVKVNGTEILTDQDFIRHALTFGKPIKSRKEGSIIDTLIAQKKEDTTKDSLSKRYGLAQFPIHTDCAYLRIPPKYILLRYVGSIKNPTPTIIIDFDFSKLTIDEHDFLFSSVWYVKSADGGFYSTICKEGLIRYDTEVMRSVNSINNKMETILKKMETKTIEWTNNKVVIINNWTTLHFRPKVTETENHKRILQRINIL